MWGNNPIYTIGAIKNAEIAEKIFPDWVCRYYIGQSTSRKIINKLKEFNNTEIIVMEEDGDWTGMFWRFYPASEDEVDVMISRDTDCRLSLREKHAIDEWLSSEKDFHIMRDHPYHNIEILGGMWGVKNHFLKQMVQLCKKFNKKNEWQTDQSFLKKIVYPIIKKNAITHDEFFNYSKNQNKFPTIRAKKEFIGQAFNENDLPLNPEHLDLLIDKT